jgi:uncharacterized membrane protein YfcA
VIYIIEFLTSVISGIISGLGMGGGTILILIFTVFLNMDQHIAQATNLIFFIPTAIIATYINKKQKLLDVKTGIVIGIFGAVGAVIGALISNKLNAQSLRKYFGFFLMIITIHEIYSYIKLYISKKTRNNNIK